jgi:hypothetical protein
VLKKKLWAHFQRIIELFTPEIFTKLSKIWVLDPGSGKNLFRIPDPRVKKHRIPDPDPQHWSYLYLLDPGLKVEFLDINLTKDSFATCYSQSLLLADFKENHTVLFSGFKNPYKKIRETR